MHFQQKKEKIVFYFGVILKCLSFLWQSSFPPSQRLSNYASKAAEGFPTVLKTGATYHLCVSHYENGALITLGHLVTLPKIYIESIYLY